MSDAAISPERLARWVTALLEAHGTPSAGAERVALALVDADRCGHRSHGVRQLPYYLDLIDRGELHPDAEAVVTEDTGALVRLDGQRGFGQLAGERATDICLSRAARYGVAVVCGRDAGHLGRLGAYTERIAAEGMAGILLVNNQGGDQQIAPFGSAERRLTNNPVSIGVPGAVLDMALSVAAEGRVQRAHERGEAVPAGWIIDSEGSPSTDPQAYLDGGSLLPVGGAAGGHKGYGLIVLVELLVGLLTTGGMCRPGEPPFSNAFVLICIDPGAEARDAYLTELPGFVDWVKSAAPLDGASEILIPGEPEARRRAATDDVALDEPTLRALDELGRTSGCPFPSA
jgi:uncharacterized oxidoreductase